MKEEKVEMGEPMAQSMTMILTALRLSGVELNAQTAAALLCLGSYTLCVRYKEPIRTREIFEEFMKTREEYFDQVAH